jgi:peroxiredoxin
MIGSNAPDFKVKSISGQSIELSKLKGQVIVLNFWNTGCKPCIAEMPALNEIVQKYKGKDISFISFAPEGEERIREFLKQRRFDFMAVANVDRVIKEDFLTDSIYPYTMIIDKKGKVKKILLGGVEDKEKTFKRILPSIDECLAEKG